MVVAVVEVVEVVVATNFNVSSRQSLNPNNEGVPATNLSEGGGADSAPPLVNSVFMAQMS